MVANGLNSVMIIGNLGRDPELRYTQRGTAVASFSVAVNSWKAEGKEEEVEWFNVVAWDKLAETCSQYLAKGRRVYISGRQQTRSWEGQDGEKKYRTELVARDMILLDKAPEGRPGVAPDEGFDDAGDLSF